MSIRFFSANLALCAASLSIIAVAQPPGMMGREERPLLDQFDADKSGWLDREERELAREFVRANPMSRRGPGGPGFGPPPGFGAPDGFGPPPDAEPGDRERPSRGPEPPRGFGPPQRGGPGFGGPGFGGPGFGGPGGGPGPGGRGPGGRGPAGRGPGGNRPEASPGVQIEKSSAEPLPNDLYDTRVLRTIFIDFENDDWESELEDFHGSDVDVAATLTVDGNSYPNCGIHFRGMSSYDMVPAGYKRSLNVSADMADQSQRILGYKTLNLLNGSGDESMMSTVLYSHISRQYLPTPKANFVRVVINGENWGIYTNVQQFNKEFLIENYDSGEGARWKVSGSPQGGGGLDYRGDDPADYRYPYEQKSGGKKATAKLIELCRVLDQTPPEQLPALLETMVDVDQLLWFLAIDNGLINSDGYWVRASDYSIYLDQEDRFHFLPHDMNEAFRGAGMGGPRGRGPGGDFGRRPDSGSPVELDPLVGMQDPSKPLRSKVLAVPKYRDQYLANLRELADKSLDWDALEPFISSQVELIDEAIKTETRKLGTYDAFVLATNASQHQPRNTGRDEARGGHGAMNLKQFVDGRRQYLLHNTPSPSAP